VQQAQVLPKSQIGQAQRRQYRAKKPSATTDQMKTQSDPGKTPYARWIWLKHHLLAGNHEAAQRNADYKHLRSTACNGMATEVRLRTSGPAT
jgi:hypothetical protein